MNNPFYIAKRDGRTDRGTWYSVLQDEMNRFHVSVSLNNNTIYECFTNVPNFEFLIEKIKLLEDELLTMDNPNDDRREQEKADGSTKGHERLDAESGSGEEPAEGSEG